MQTPSYPPIGDVTLPAASVATAAPPVSRWRAWAGSLAVPVAVFTVTRAGLFLLAYLSLVLMPLDTSKPRPFAHNLFLDGWLRWDGGWYKGIAVRGYSNIPAASGESNVAFFPFYPLLIRALHTVIPDPYVAALLVSNVAFLLALIVLYRLARLYLDEGAARRTLVLVAVFPFAFYFSAVYSESVFLLAVVAAFYFGERRRWLWAALAAAAASATRAVGIFTVVGLVVLYLQHIDFQWRRVRPDILWLALGGAGLVAWMVYLGSAFGNPLAFAYAQDVAGWGYFGPGDMLSALRSALSVSALLDGTYRALAVIHALIGLGALALGVVAWRRIGPAYAVWSLLVVVASFSMFVGMGRYVSVVFPVFMVGALLLKDTRWYQATLYVSILLLALFTIMFSHWLFLT